MKKLLLAIITLSFFIIDSSAQSPVNVPTIQIFMEDVGGRPLRLKGVEEVEGNPYLIDEWKRGTVNFIGGEVLNDVELKFSLYGSQLFFRKDNEMMEFSNPVKEFQFVVKKNQVNKIQVYRANFPAIANNTDKIFYEVLSDGDYQLLKHHFREIQEYKSYNEPPRKRFVDKEVWYVYDQKNNRITILKKDKKSLGDLIPLKSDLIQKVIREKSLNLKNDDHLVALFDAINSQK